MGEFLIALSNACRSPTGNNRHVIGFFLVLRPGALRRATNNAGSPDRVPALEVISRRRPDSGSKEAYTESGVASRRPYVEVAALCKKPQSPNGFCGTE